MFSVLLNARYSMAGHGTTSYFPGVNELELFDTSKTGLPQVINLRYNAATHDTTSPFPDVKKELKF